MVQSSIACCFEFTQSCFQEFPVGYSSIDACKTHRGVNMNRVLMNITISNYYIYHLHMLHMRCAYKVDIPYHAPASMKRCLREDPKFLARGCHMFFLAALILVVLIALDIYIGTCRMVEVSETH